MNTAERLEREIEGHRAGVEQTLDKLKRRMSVDNIVDEVGQFIGVEDVRGSLHAASQQVRENPVALGLIGLGIVWLMIGNGAKSGPVHKHRAGGKKRKKHAAEWDSGSYRAATRTDGDGIVAKASRVATDIGERTSRVAGDIGDTASRVAGDIGEKASRVAGNIGAGIGGATDRIKDMASDAADRVQSGVSSTRQSAAGVMRPVSEQIMSHPLLLGAVAVVAGAVIGSALPRTRAEDRILGPQRDQLLDEAKAATSAMRDRAMEAAQSTYGAAVRAARDEGLLPDGETTIAQKIEQVATAAVDEARAHVDPVLHGQAEPVSDEPSEDGTGRA